LNHPGAAATTTTSPLTPARVNTPAASVVVSSWLAWTETRAPAMGWSVAPSLTVPLTCASEALLKGHPEQPSRPPEPTSNAHGERARQVPRHGTRAAQFGAISGVNGRSCRFGIRRDCA
jgi:hypothetical protein